MKKLFLILVFCVKNDFAQLIYRVTLRMLATDFRFFLVSINHALFSSVRFNPLQYQVQDQAFLPVPFGRMNVSHYPVLLSSDLHFIHV